MVSTSKQCDALAYSNVVVKQHAFLGLNPTSRSDELEAVLEFWSRDLVREVFRFAPGRPVIRTLLHDETQNIVLRSRDGY